MSKLVWVLCTQDDDGKRTEYVGERGVPMLDHDEIKGGLYRKY